MKDQFFIDENGVLITKINTWKYFEINHPNLKEIEIDGIFEVCRIYI